MRKIAALLALPFLIFSLSCKKQPGEGGNATITGKIKIQDCTWNSNGTSVVVNYEYPGYDTDVYITYGDGNGTDDRVRTDGQGYFNFKYLRKGKYKVFVLSKTKATVTPYYTYHETKTFEVNIGKNKETVDLGEIIIRD